MTILIIGSGGREHALAAAYAKSRAVKWVYVLPGNDLMPLTSPKIATVPKISLGDFERILLFTKNEAVDVIDVAQDEPLANGYVNRFLAAGFQAFGPTKEAAQLEWSKEWSRYVMKKYHLPIPEFHVFHNPSDAKTYIKNQPETLRYIKASGLAGGKGALRARSKDEALQAIAAMEGFGSAGKTFLIEEGLEGEEFSLFILCDGTSYQLLGGAQDHKTVFNNNHGPNTGGMGCVSPPKSLTPTVVKNIEQAIIKPLLQGMQQEGRPYTGILYIGGMLTNPPAARPCLPTGKMPARQGRQVNVIEFNARWGDPEAEVILPSLTTDYARLIENALMGNLSEIKVQKDTAIRISVAGCAMGYPGNYKDVLGKEIFGLKEATSLPNITIFGAGIKKKNKRFFVNGGRIFHLVAQGTTIAEARQKAYEAMSLIFVAGNNLHYRTDIGWKDVERMYRNFLK